MAGHSKKQKLYVRFSTSADVKAILDFYQSNEHEYVAHRDPAVLKECVDSGAVTLIEDAAGKIIATSISYPIMDDQDRHKWTEIGSTRIALSGAGLFEAIFSAQILRAYLLEPPEDRFVIEIDVDNKHSKHVFEKAGCQPYQIPEGLRKLAEESMAPEDRGVPVDWYQFGIEGIPELAEKLLNKLDNPSINDLYEFDFSRCQLTNMFEKQLRHLSNQDYGDHAKADLKKGLRDQRDQLNKKFKP